MTKRYGTLRRLQVLLLSCALFFSEECTAQVDMAAFNELLKFAAFTIPEQVIDLSLGNEVVIGATRCSGFSIGGLAIGTIKPNNKTMAADIVIHDLSLSCTSGTIALTLFDTESVSLGTFSASSVKSSLNTILSFEFNETDPLMLPEQVGLNTCKAQLELDVELNSGNDVLDDAVTKLETVLFENFQWMLNDLICQQLTSFVGPAISDLVQELVVEIRTAPDPILPGSRLDLNNDAVSQNDEEDTSMSNKNNAFESDSDAFWFEAESDAGVPHSGDSVAIAALHPIREVLSAARGALIELDAASGSGVEDLINGALSNLFDSSGGELRIHPDTVLFSGKGNGLVSVAVVLETIVISGLDSVLNFDLIRPVGNATLDNTIYFKEIKVQFNIRCDLDVGKSPAATVLKGYANLPSPVSSNLELLVTLKHVHLSAAFLAVVSHTAANKLQIGALWNHPLDCAFVVFALSRMPRVALTADTFDINVEKTSGGMAIVVAQVVRLLNSLFEKSLSKRFSALATKAASVLLSELAAGKRPIVPYCPTIPTPSDHVWFDWASEPIMGQLRSLVEDTIVPAVNANSNAMAYAPMVHERPMAKASDPKFGNFVAVVHNVSISHVATLHDVMILDPKTTTAGSFLLHSSIAVGTPVRPLTVSAALYSAVESDIFPSSHNNFTVTLELENIEGAMDILAEVDRGQVAAMPALSLSSDPICWLKHVTGGIDHLAVILEGVALGVRCAPCTSKLLLQLEEHSKLMRTSNDLTDNLNLFLEAFLDKTLTDSKAKSFTRVLKEYCSTALSFEAHVELSKALGYSYGENSEHKSVLYNAALANTFSTPNNAPTLKPTRQAPEINHFTLNSGIATIVALAITFVCVLALRTSACTCLSNILRSCCCCCCILWTQYHGNSSSGRNGDHDALVSAFNISNAVDDLRFDDETYNEIGVERNGSISNGFIASRLARFGSIFGNNVDTNAQVVTPDLRIQNTNTKSIKEYKRAPWQTQHSPRAAEESDNEQTETDRYTPALCVHPNVPRLARILLPLSIACNALVLVCGHLLIAINVGFFIDLAGDLVHVPQMVSVSIFECLQTTWDGSILLVAIFITFVSGVWPYMKLMGILFCWCTPTTTLNVRARRKLLGALEVFTKWAMLEAILLMVLVTIFNMTVTNPPSSILPANLYSATLHITPGWGLMCFTLSALWSILNSNIALALHRRAVRLHEATTSTDVLWTTCVPDLEFDNVKKKGVNLNNPFSPESAATAVSKKKKKVDEEEQQQQQEEEIQTRSRRMTDADKQEEDQQHATVVVLPAALQRSRNRTKDMDVRNSESSERIGVEVAALGEDIGISEENGATETKALTSVLGRLKHKLSPHSHKNSEEDSEMGRTRFTEHHVRQLSKKDNDVDLNNSNNNKNSNNTTEKSPTAAKYWSQRTNTKPMKTRVQFPQRTTKNTKGRKGSWADRRAMRQQQKQGRKGWQRLKGSGDVEDPELNDNEHDYLPRISLGEEPANYTCSVMRQHFNLKTRARVRVRSSVRVVVALSLLAGIICAFGAIILPNFTLTNKGLLGVASPTSPRVFSLFDMSVSQFEHPAPSASNTTSEVEVFVPQYFNAVFLLGVVGISPILRGICALTLWVFPLQLGPQRRLLHVSSALSAWGAVEVFLAVVAVCVLELPTISFMLVGLVCDVMQPMLVAYMAPLGLLASDRISCLTVHMDVNVGLLLMLASVVLLKVGCHVVIAIGQRAVATREAEFWGKTCVVGGVVRKLMIKQSASSRADSY